VEESALRGARPENAPQKCPPRSQARGRHARCVHQPGWHVVWCAATASGRGTPLMTWHSCWPPGTRFYALWTRSSRASTRRRLRVCVAGWRCVSEAECTRRGRPGVSGPFSNGCPLRPPALQASKTPTSPFIAPGQQAQVCAPPVTQQTEQRRGSAKRQCPLARPRTAHTTRPFCAAPDPNLLLRCQPAACRLRLRGRRRHTRCVYPPRVRQLSGGGHLQQLVLTASLWRPTTERPAAGLPSRHRQQVSAAAADSP
jgi:hypothetical protein